MKHWPFRIGSLTRRNAIPTGAGARQNSHCSRRNRLGEDRDSPSSDDYRSSPSRARHSSFEEGTTRDLGEYVVSHDHARARSLSLLWSTRHPKSHRLNAPLATASAARVWRGCSSSLAVAVMRDSRIYRTIRVWLRRAVYSSSRAFERICAAWRVWTFAVRARDQQRVGERDTGRVCARSGCASAMGIDAEGTPLFR